MKLHNNFQEYIKSIFYTIQPYCWKCKSNKELSIHHIYSRISNALFNGILLCGECHRIADNFNIQGGINGKKVRRDLLFLSLEKLYKNNWWQEFMTEEYSTVNNNFCELIKEDLQYIQQKLLEK